MKTLAIDTSNQVMGVAVSDGPVILGEIITNMKKNHSVRLLPAIDTLLQEVQLETTDLECVAVAHGPGSYTGVRIGVTVAKTMAWSLDIPLVGVSSLEVLAQNSRHFDGCLSPLFDARRGRVYTGLYRHEQGNSKNVEEDRVTVLHNWLALLKKRAEKILFLGQGLSQHKETIADMLGAQAFFAEPGEQNPRPGELALLANQRITAGPVHEKVPAYLQLAEAEAKWLAAQESKNDGSVR